MIKSKLVGPVLGILASVALASSVIAATPMTWTAKVVNVNHLDGTATLTRHTNGTGTFKLTLLHALPDSTLSIDMDAGSSAKVHEGDEVGSASLATETVGTNGAGTFSFSLSASAVSEFAKEISEGDGVAVWVNDGTHTGVASFK